MPEMLSGQQHMLSTVGMSAGCSAFSKMTTVLNVCCVCVFVHVCRFVAELPVKMAPLLAEVEATKVCLSGALVMCGCRAPPVYLMSLPRHCGFAVQC